MPMYNELAETLHPILSKVNGLSYSLKFHELEELFRKHEPLTLKITKVSVYKALNASLKTISYNPGYKVSSVHKMPADYLNDKCDTEIIIKTTLNY